MPWLWKVTDPNTGESWWTPEARVAEMAESQVYRDKVSIVAWGDGQ